MLNSTRFTMAALFEAVLLLFVVPTSNGQTTGPSPGKVLVAPVPDVLNPYVAVYGSGMPAFA